MKIFILFLFFATPIFGQTILDVTDSNAIVISTIDRGTVVSGTLKDTIANYPKLKDKLFLEVKNKLLSENEIAAQKRIEFLSKQNVEFPKGFIEEHNARIINFAKAKEYLLITTIKTAQDSISKVKIDAKDSDQEWETKQTIINTARGKLRKVKKRQEELLKAHIPISETTQAAIEAAQPKATPTPAPTPSPTPLINDDNL